ncbi:unnamed protein product [Lactuca saligna]|uniref:Disease resistance protein At4g27190-like leucine-rich repeats domain-containing protein n=1 Tax=Lactuca saligna TaxID=75948 RepID=A0AA36EFR1_LACSI|nr:unnamed protein product [Lactuca saligna]
MFDCSSIGNMLNLEVLSFANSGIELLPWTIGNLKKLKLLDLTDCGGLRIDNGVFKNLVKLQELYTICGYPPDNRIKFTDDNCNEIAEGSKNLYAFEFEFFRNNALPKNMSFENIERFKISVGCALDGNISKTKHSFENTLQLVVNKDEILESRMNELFQKTEALCLTVEDMNDLEDIGFKPSHPLHTSSFYKLRVLVVSECAELRYLFTLGIAKALPNIEQLDVESCVNMEELIHTGSNAEEIITFPKLKFLSLRWLPVLSGLSHSVKIIELPQLVELRLCGIPNITGIYTNDKFATSCFFKEEVMIPNLEKLYIFYMENLKELWPCEFRITEEVKLREIEVRYCDNLVNLFPCNPTPLLHHLEALELWDCGSIEVLFNIDLDCVSEIGEEDSNSSSLRSIKVQRFGKLTYVWRIKGADNSPHLIRDFITVESIDIRSCNMFRNVFTPVVTNFDLSALTEIFIHECGESERNNELMECIQEEKLNIVQKEDTSRVINDISNVVIPMCHMHSFRNLRSLELWGYEGVEAVFQIEGPQSRELVTTQNNQQLLPYLEELHMTFMERMSHVWKCNWNNFLITQKTHLESPFNNLTTIHMIQCKSIKYLFSPLMAKLLSKLKKVEVSDCDGIEEIVYNRDDEEKTKTDSTNTSTSLFTHFDSLTLSGLNNLKHIGGSVSNHRSNQLSFNNTTTTNAFLDQLSQVGGVCWTLCQYSREIRISRCHTLSSVIPSYAVGNMQKLQVLKIESCSLMKEIFETQDINDHNSSFHSAEETVGTPTIPGLSNVIKFKLMNLKILEIKDCSCLEHIFTFSALESLGQLEKLKIENCIAMQVIVKEEPGDQTRKTNDLVFRRLKSIALVNLPNLMSFFLGTNDFRWPLLDDVMIKDCPKMMVFTSGQSIAPKLKYIHTRFGKYSLDCGLNFPVTTTSHQTLFPVLDNTSSSSATSEGIPWSFQNLITLDLAYNKFVVKIIPSKESLQLQKLEKIHVRQCVMLEEVFEALEGTNSGFVKLPNLREVELLRLKRLRHIWKSNQWTIFEFPNLTRVSIDYCDGLEHVFTSSMVGSLLQLQELHISYCDNMEEVIVSDANVVVEEEEDGKVNEILLPRLRSLEIDSVPCLKGFCLGKEDFSLPLLSTLSIKKCPTITIFTKGNSATPELKEIETSFGSFHAQEDINAFIKIKQKEFTDADR